MPDVPSEFKAAIDTAVAEGRPGNLDLLAHEASDFSWSADGLHLIAQARATVAARGGAGAIEHVLVFTGHRVDDEGRAQTRFPRTAAAETAAKRMIHRAIANAQRAAGGPVRGIAGGASGGDILFLESCAELAIPTALLLALPPDDFARASVAGGGGNWMQRFNELCARLTPRIMTAEIGGDSLSLPDWLRAKKEYGIWQRNNLWILFNALAIGAPHLTLIALWDGGPADGPGGTQDLFAQVQARGYEAVRLPAETLKTFA